MKNLPVKAEKAPSLSTSTATKDNTLSASQSLAEFAVDQERCIQQTAKTLKAAVKMGIIDEWDLEDVIAARLAHPPHSPQYFKGVSVNEILQEILIPGSFRSFAP